MKIISPPQVSETPRPRAAAPGLARLAAALHSPACYPHPADRVEMLETHISVVLLAGEFAYKLKKPVNLGFLDFSTLTARREACEAELRLNRRTAPGLYLDVVPVTGTRAAPVMGGQGTPIEYAVRMRRFPQEALLDRIARAGKLQAAQVEALARSVARFHASAPRAAPEAGFATPELILEVALDNFRQIESAGIPSDVHAALEALREWTLREHEMIRPKLARRLAGGYVRECHGDLHLGNLVMLEGVPVPFDCIEFNERLRWIDVMSDVAFATMDLVHHGLPALAARFLDTWVEESGDHAGLAVLRFYLVYRAMVRAKVASIRARQSGRGAADEETREHLSLAKRLSQRTRPALVLMQGLSGSGKTVVSRSLADALGAIRLRSDVERKRLHGLAPLARAEAAPGAGIYTQGESERTYARLAELANEVMQSGWPVVVDATFLKRSQREAIRAVAAEAGARFAIAECVAPDAVLHRRIAERAAAGSDASDAGVAVLEMQRASAEALSDAEREAAITIETEFPAAQSGAIEVLARRFGIAEAGLKAMRAFDVFNGDADGICALRQLRLANPAEAELVTGPKRDIALLERVPAGEGDTVTVLDVSLERNREALLAMLARGAEVRYFDHHFAGDIPDHPAFKAVIDTASGQCTSSLVDRHLGGRFRAWAVAGAFGDNFPELATRLAQSLGLKSADVDALRELGEALNYNAYGDGESAMLVPPADLYRVVSRYEDPLALARGEPLIARLAGERRADLARALAVAPAQDTPGSEARVLPDAPWSRRVSGTLANHLALAEPDRAHAVITTVPAGGYCVSVRSPRAQAPTAVEFCRRYAGGGGRADAAGIDHLAPDALDPFLAEFARAWAR